MNATNPEPLRPVTWSDGAIRMLDQTRLPQQSVYLRLDEVDAVHEAIRMLRVRGAPAIGIAAAYGVALGAVLAPDAPRAGALAAADHLATARPTAVNLFWAIERMRAVTTSTPDDASLPDRLVGEADAILEEDLEMSRALGGHGADLLGPKPLILTHCNTGGLATGGLGTALGIVYEAQRRGLEPTVLADETRPLLQGGRLTAWECERAGIPVRVLVDGAAAWALRTLPVDAVIIGTDRVARNGDVANKIGSYGVALAAREAGVPFYVAAPTTTLDARTPDGSGIQIEERDADEVRRPGGTLVTPPDIGVYNPAFDVTPAALVSALITERGVSRPPFAEIPEWAPA
jgi:methylthioribose-1-phosphate isomerase